MRYGFYLPTRGQTATPEALATLVTRAESFGFHSVMIADHIVFPTEIHSKYPYTLSGAFPGHGDTLEQLTLMAFIAAKTTHLRLVTSVRKASTVWSTSPRSSSPPPEIERHEPGLRDTPHDAVG